jgi:hypothetical protein
MKFETHFSSHAVTDSRRQRQISGESGGQHRTYAPHVQCREYSNILLSAAPIDAWTIWWVETQEL